MKNDFLIDSFQYIIHIEAVFHYVLSSLRKWSELSMKRNENSLKNFIITKLGIYFKIYNINGVQGRDYA
jgi:hypothetical protein